MLAAFKLMRRAFIKDSSGTCLGIHNVQAPAFVTVTLLSKESSTLTPISTHCTAHPSRHLLWS